VICTVRVMRDVSWKLSADYGLRAANHARLNPDDEDYYLGFRCTRSS
jgi:formylglycine-generating enzyme required for sulfatase activity